MKRGQAEIWQIDSLFQLIIGMLVASAMIYAVYNLNYGEDFSRQLFEEDIGLTIEAIKIVPGDIELEYPLGKGNFEVKVVNNEVIVTGGSSIFDIALSDTRFLILEKKGNDIFVNGAKI